MNKGNFISIMATVKESDSAFLLFAFTQDGDFEFLMCHHDYTFQFCLGLMEKNQPVCTKGSLFYVRLFVAGVFLGALLYQYGFMLGYQDSWNV